MSSHIIWNTELVNETIQKLRQGVDCDLGCFYERSPELKAPNIPFQLTQEEVDEFIKCSNNIEYFVETYCKFLTDKGRTTVVLRDFQRDILNTLGEEEWIESLKEFGPKVKNFLLMSSRQSGKCLFNSQLVIRNIATNNLSKININDLYYILNSKNVKSFKLTCISIIKKILYKMYHLLS
jgi:hypothetical protein